MSPPCADTIRLANETLLVEGDGQAAERFFQPGYVAHATAQDLKGGPAAVRSFVKTLRAAFTDLEVQVQVLVEAADRVAWYRTVSATHSGDFMGFPATGRPIVWRDMIVSRFEGDRIAEEWVVTDLAERLLLARKG